MPQSEVNMFTRLNPFNDEARDHLMTQGDSNGGLVLPESSGEGQGQRGQKRRAETWVTEETQCLISLRRELHGLFNSSKSNRHIWEQIAARMREMGWERTASMCCEKWRNLVKEFKKVKKRNGVMQGVPFYDEVAEYFSEKKRSVQSKNPRAGFQYSDRAFNLEQRLDHDGDPLGVSEAGAVVTNGLPAWNWRGTPRNGGENESRYTGRLRVIPVTWGDCTKRIGIDGSSEAIKEAIKSAFGLRTNRAFWLEDEDEIVRALDREMPLRNYRLHLDEGLTIKVCLSDVSNHRPCRFIEKTFYRDDDLSTFLRSFGWIGIRGLRCNKHIDSLDDLVMDEVYHGVRLVTN
ncbi:hypothetical protein RJ639_002553 [Escallonia herrerae]|uniref:Myb-like domain-containing protein n=1 Tax=Escallonia herrerae TaxID=1293975 RepID=A0AA88XRK4_9ASTE|nr:hypothetical protein RJ639_002553 [Escallonia herrerae]